MSRWLLGQQGLRIMQSVPGIAPSHATTKTSPTGVSRQTGPDGSVKCYVPQPPQPQQ